MSILQSMSSGISAAGSSSSSSSSSSSGSNSDTTTYDPLDVSDEVSKITNQNSLAMRSAKALGNQTAAARGMQNSTLGSEAAQRAMLDAALPMAQQNVSQRQQTALQDDAQGFTSQQNQLDRNQQTNLQNDAQQFTSEQNALDRTQQTNLQNDAQAHDTKMQEDSVRANTVGAYLDAANELQTSFFDAYKEIQASEVPVDQKQAAIADLYNKQQQQINQMKSMYQNLATTEADWSNFADLIN